MKKTLSLQKLLCSFTVIALLSFIACKKDKEPINQLPPETQIGAGTFGCKINGKVWATKDASGNTGLDISVVYRPLYPYSAEYIFYVAALNDIPDPMEGVGIFLEGMKLIEGMRVPLQLRRRELNGWATFGKVGNSEHNTTDSHTGELHFTRLDEVNQVISGKFWFDAINPNGEIIHVTEGRFDVKFIR